MKFKYLFLITLSLVFFLSWATLSSLQENQEQALELSVAAGKNTYLKGEMISVTFRLKNKGLENLTLANNFNTEDGYLHLYISRDGTEFNKYTNWGDKDVSHPPLRLIPDESIETSATVFWNQKPKVAGLSPNAVKKVAGNKILTDYAFPESGTYFIKAVYSGRYSEERRAKLESEPVQITVEEPAGDDLQAWNKIKNKGDIGYFIQEGDFPTFKDDEKERLKQEVEQIFNQHRNSVIGRQIGNSLEKFKIKEEKRKKIKESFPPRNNQKNQ